jgi:hypothetical protein
LGRDCTVRREDAVISDWLQTLETKLVDGGDDELAIALISIAYVASASVDLPDDERRAAGRRAMLVLAAGGDPRRGLDLDGPAVTGLATELETPARVAALEAGLVELEATAEALPQVSQLAAAMRTDMPIAWRAYAASILADELDEDDAEPA